MAVEPVLRNGRHEIQGLVTAIFPYEQLHQAPDPGPSFVGRDSKPASRLEAFFDQTGVLGLSPSVTNRDEAVLGG
jgi:hypothetical protein